MEGGQLRTWVARAGVLAMVVALLVLGWMFRPRTVAEVGAYAPDARMATLDGDSVALSDHAGQVVLLNFWATWCPPCVREMPAMERVYQKLKDRGFTVLAVSVDRLAPPDSSGRRGANVRQFVERLDLSFPILLDPEGTVERLYNVSGLPTSYVIGPDGRIEGRIVGAREWDSPEYTRRIVELLEE